MKNQLPPKWCIRRTPQNYEQVNQVMSRIYAKEYTGHGPNKFQDHDFMHFPPIKTKRYSKGRVALIYPQHQEITLQDIENRTNEKRLYKKLVWCSY